MKKISFFCTLIAFSLFSRAQENNGSSRVHHNPIGLSVRDTTIESDTTKENREPRYFYMGIASNIFVNSTGGIAKRFALALEFGRTYGIFDIGIAMGRLSSLASTRDSSVFVEVRPTINVFSKGRFSEGLCLGAGYVFGAKETLMTEICNSINFNISEITQVSVTQGYIFFDGTESGRGTQFMGVNFTYNFLKPHSVNMRRKKAAIIGDN
ncbi:hypothetical protein ABIB40_003940 [Pedobacter sp. UYP30]|uniref:hypothetical protein n=1 Tax=Pedobacter sp. UYP30 TaxID=1756400 RepID=UPI0033914BA1